MIVSLVEDDMITFYEIYEMFDNLNMFDSKHEKDVSQRLTNIGEGLEDSNVRSKTIWGIKYLIPLKNLVM